LNHPARLTASGTGRQVRAAFYRARAESERGRAELLDPRDRLAWWRSADPELRVHRARDRRIGTVERGQRSTPLGAPRRPCSERLIGQQSQTLAPRSEKEALDRDESSDIADVVIKLRDQERTRVVELS